MVKAIFAVLGGFCVLVMGSLSYAGIALLMGIESACIPLPSELIMPYAGAMTDAKTNAELTAQFGLALPCFQRLDRGCEICALFGDNTGQDVWNRVDQGCVFMVSGRRAKGSGAGG
jgi:hypothetical protein